MFFFFPGYVFANYNFLVFMSYTYDPKKEKAWEIHSWRGPFGNIRHANSLPGAAQGKQGHPVALTVWRWVLPPMSGRGNGTQGSHVYVAATVTCSTVMPA